MNKLSDNEIYDKYKDKIIAINQHIQGCGYTTRSVPVSVCPCDCYTKQLFTLGRKAEQNLTNKRIRR